MTRLDTIDAHAEGGPLRLVVRGFPSLPGGTMFGKLDWAAEHADHLRRALMCEPRGHQDMCGAVLTEPVTPGAHAGILFMDSSGFTPLSGHGVIAVATIALERGLMMPGGDKRTIVVDTAVGTIRVRAEIAGTPHRVERVAYTGVPSFVHQGGVRVRVGARELPADVAFGGAFYAIVDSESVGLALAPTSLPELRRAGVAVCRALSSAVAHPLDPRVDRLRGAIFTSASDEGRADLRTITVFADGRVDHSPSGTGTAAVMAVLSQMGLVAEGVPFVQEGFFGRHLTGRVVRRTSVGEHQAIVPEIAGTAWITGEHAFLVDPGDPLGNGWPAADGAS